MILVVEDDVLLRSNLVEALRDQVGFTVWEAEDGSNALKILEREEHIAFVVTDIEMPGRPDGVALYNEIKRRYPDTDVLLASGTGRPKGLPTEVPYVDKPYDIVDIIECIRLGRFSDRRCLDRFNKRRERQSIGSSSLGSMGSVRAGAAIVRAKCS